jgi:hypothetical protein
MMCPLLPFDVDPELNERPPLTPFADVQVPPAPCAVHVWDVAYWGSEQLSIAFDVLMLKDPLDFAVP